MKTRNKVLMASAVAGLLAMSSFAPTTAVAEEGEKVKCYGANKCKGTGECGGKGHSCAGENACKGQGYIKADKDECLKMEGGRLTPDAE
jgi:uncharacterized membrane protein